MLRSQLRAQARLRRQARHQQVLALRAAGASYSAIAQATGCSRTGVFDICARALAGAGAPVPAGAPVLRRRLTPLQEQQVRGWLAVPWAVPAAGPQTLADGGPAHGLWTRQAVLHLILLRLGLRLALRTVAAYLLRWDVVPRHPLRLLVARPWPADQQWLRDQYPAIARRARLEGAEIQWAGARALLHAPGQLLSSVSNRGLMRWCSLPAPAQAADWIDFLRRLVAGAPCKLLLIVAAGGLHQELELQRWLAEHEDQIVLLSGPPAA